MTETAYRWQHARLGLCLLLYWLGCMIGAGVLARAGAAKAETAWIVLAMLVVVTVCMITERGRWKTWQRIMCVPLAWVAQPLFAIPVALTIGVLVFGAGRKDLVDGTITFRSSLPGVLFAMRQSRLFGAPSGVCSAR